MKKDLGTLRSNKKGRNLVKTVFGICRYREKMKMKMKIQLEEAKEQSAVSGKLVSFWHFFFFYVERLLKRAWRMMMIIILHFP